MQLSIFICFLLPLIRLLFYTYKFEFGFMYNLCNKSYLKDKTKKERKLTLFKVESSFSKN
jgi:hypothetical protein